MAKKEAAAPAKKRPAGLSDRERRGVVLLPVEVAPELRDRITDAAYQARIHRADWIRGALEKYLEKSGK